MYCACIARATSIHQREMRAHATCAGARVGTHFCMRRTSFLLLFNLHTHAQYSCDDQPFLLSIPGTSRIHFLYAFLMSMFRSSGREAARGCEAAARHQGGSKRLRAEMGGFMWGPKRSGAARPQCIPPAQCEAHTFRNNNSKPPGHYTANSGGACGDTNCSRPRVTRCVCAFVC